MTKERALAVAIGALFALCLWHFAWDSNYWSPLAFSFKPVTWYWDPKS